MSDLQGYLLLTAAGCVMVGVTAPSLLRSSAVATRTFETQVSILESGANPAGGGVRIEVNLPVGGVSGGAREQAKSPDAPQAPPTTIDEIRRRLNL